MIESDENNSSLRKTNNTNTQNAEYSRFANDTIQSDEEQDDSCSCNKWQCVLGISSVAIGLGGFILAMLL